MMQTSSDALVFFGATGDLAHKKIFPALQKPQQSAANWKYPSSGSPNPDGTCNNSRSARRTVSRATADLMREAFPN